MSRRHHAALAAAAALLVAAASLLAGTILPAAASPTPGGLVGPADYKMCQAAVDKLGQRFLERTTGMRFIGHDSYTVISTGGPREPWHGFCEFWGPVRLPSHHGRPQLELAHNPG